MSKPHGKTYIHITETGVVERHPFSGLTLDQLKPMVGDRSGQCRLGLTYRYFTDPVVLIANDDDFGSKPWPVSAVINEHHFRGAFVILTERTVDPNSRPLWGETFMDGLTGREFQQVVLAIRPPPGCLPRYRI